MWSTEYNSDADETTFQWTDPDGVTTATTISGQHTEMINGLPKSSEAREAIAELIQSAGTPERIRMMWDANYPFEDVTADEQP